MFDVRCFSNILHHDTDRPLEVSDNVWDRWTILSDPDEDEMVVSRRRGCGFG